MSRADFEVIEKALQSTNDDPAIYIAELDGGIAGFIHLHSVVDYYRQRQHGHVADLVVDPAAEGQGVATRLLSEAELWARRQSFDWLRSEEHTSELQSLMRISYAVFCLKKKMPSYMPHS